MKTNNEIKDCLMSGKSIDKWHEDKIKANNRNWGTFVLFILLLWVGHYCVIGYIHENRKPKADKKDSIISYQQRQIDTLQSAVYSAVYFYDIVNGKTTK